MPAEGETFWDGAGTENAVGRVEGMLSMKEKFHHWLAKRPYSLNGVVCTVHPS
jgi:hypothetical protein